MKINVFKSPITRQWYFHIQARNGKIIAQSEGYKRRQSLYDTLKLLGTGCFQVIEDEAKR